MSTMVMSYVRDIDKNIPDLTKEIAIDKTKSIKNHLKDALICAGASMICTAKAIEETTELTVIASKTVVKKAGTYAMNVYCDNAPNVVVRR